MDKSNTFYYIIGLFVFYLVAFIAHQVLLLDTYKNNITWDSLSYLILTICIVLPLSILFNEVELFGFKLKREFNDFKNDVSKTLSIMQNTVATSVKQQTNIKVDIDNKGSSDVNYQDNILDISELQREKEEEQ